MIDIEPMEYFNILFFQLQPFGNPFHPQPSILYIEKQGKDPLHWFNGKDNSRLEDVAKSTLIEEAMGYKQRLFHYWDMNNRYRNPRQALLDADTYVGIFQFMAVREDNYQHKGFFQQQIDFFNQMVNGLIAECALLDHNFIWAEKLIENELDREVEPPQIFGNPYEGSIITQNGIDDFPDIKNYFEILDSMRKQMEKVHEPKNKLPAFDSLGSYSRKVRSDQHDYSQRDYDAQMKEFERIFHSNHRIPLMKFMLPLLFMRHLGEDAFVDQGDIDNRVFNVENGLSELAVTLTPDDEPHEGINIHSERFVQRILSLVHSREYAMIFGRPVEGGYFNGQTFLRQQNSIHQ